ncbi:MAG: hypothetical protein L0228_21215 [Planctomycetes bacterium]|nr:hypothetical protein [Planctomycetota bacterium]
MRSERHVTYRRPPASPQRSPLGSQLPLNAHAAEQFANFLTDPTTQQLIANFGVDKFGEPLFYPTNSPTPSESSSAP